MKFSFSSPLNAIAQKIGVDLGASRTRIWSDKEGFVLDEPSCIAVDTSQEKVIAVGDEAQEMIGRVHQHIVVSFPIRTEGIAQPELVTAMLKVFLQKTLRTPYFFRPAFMVSIPSYINETEKKALIEILYSLGAREVSLIQQILAAAIGAGVPIADASGSFLLQLGSRVVEGGIISLGSLIASETSFHAGHYIDESIQRVLKKEEHIKVGVRTAEGIKKQIATARENQHLEMRVTGQDLLAAAPKELTVDSETLFPAIAFVVERYVVLARKLFEQIPAELTSDVIDKGILLSGGLARLDGLDLSLLNLLGVPVSVVEEPDRAVIKGIAQVLQNLELFKESVGYKE